MPHNLPTNHDPESSVDAKARIRVVTSGDSDTSGLMRSLALAIDAGTEAEDAVKIYAAAIELPRGSNWPFLGLAARLQRKAVVSPGPDQARRSCRRVDEFAVALADLAAKINNDALSDHASNANRWSDLLWETNANGAAVYNDVRAMVARLNQIQTRLILNLPVNDMEF